jgi:hypothetical protein
LTTTAKAIIVKKRHSSLLLRRASFANWISGEFGMFYMNIRHNVKKDSSSKNTFHYLTRTAHFAEQKADENWSLCVLEICLLGLSMHLRLLA